MKTNDDFQAVFARLRAILHPHAARFKLTADTPEHYSLDIPYSPKFKKGFPVAWINISKSYVSYHFMPVYMFPKLRDSMSDQLKARMQGKSCFNFKTIDEKVFQELEQVTLRGFALGREAGVAPNRAA
jgi:hypothetical protein